MCTLLNDTLANCIGSQIQERFLTSFTRSLLIETSNMSAYECQRFITNPLSYVRDVCINVQTCGRRGVGAFNANLSYAHCWFDLVPWSTSLFGGASQVMLEPTAVLRPGLIQGYYVPYISYGNVVSTSADHIAPVLLDGVPRTLPPNSFVFTGGQNGCSLLMMNGSTPNTLSFLHYPNSDGKQQHYPILAQVGKTEADIILSIDFDIYGEPENPNACSFFLYNGTEWVAVTQPQVQGAINETWWRRSMSINRNMRPRYFKTSGGGVIP